MAQSFMQILKNNTVTIALNIIAFFALLANLWLSTQLQPIISKNQDLELRVVALERHIIATTPLIERFYKVESEIPHLKESVDNMNTKLDILIERER